MYPRKNKTVKVDQMKLRISKRIIVDNFSDLPEKEDLDKYIYLDCRHHIRLNNP